MIIEFIRKKSFEGGAGTFQGIFENYLINKSCKLVYYGEKILPDVCFVISGTRHIFHLIYYKFRGVKIIQRLDGYNWRIKYKQDSVANILKMKLQNYLMNLIRKHIADEVVYQSNFVKKSWNNKFGTTKKNTSIILNCANKKFFQEPKINGLNNLTVTCVEGHIQDDETTRNILSELNKLTKVENKISDIEIYGKVKNKNFHQMYENIDFKNHISRSEVSKIYQEKKRIFFCLEINPPCPNSLIEAIACQIPCVGFDTGSFKEIVHEAGIAIPYGANPWEENSPNYSAVNTYIKKAIKSYDKFSHEAKSLRKKYYSEYMCDSYYQLIKKK